MCKYIWRNLSSCVGWIVQACDPSMQVAEVGGHCEFKASLGSIVKPCPQKPKTTKNKSGSGLVPISSYFCRICMQII